MLRRELEVKGKENIEKILKKCCTCRIAMIADEKPYILPMVYGYDWNDEDLYLYFHCGLKGRKNAALKQNPVICFEMDIEGGLIGEGGPAHKHSRAFSAVIGEGTIEFAKNSAQKRIGFDYIMKHQTGKADWDYNESYLATTEVFRIHVTKITGSHKSM